MPWATNLKSGTKVPVEVAAKRAKVLASSLGTLSQNQGYLLPLPPAPPPFFLSQSQMLQAGLKLAMELGLQTGTTRPG